MRGLDVLQFQTRLTMQKTNKQTKTNKQKQNQKQNPSFSSVSVRCRVSGLRTLTSSGISLRLARALLEFTVALWRFPKRRKYGRLSAPYFLPFENDEYYYPSFPQDAGIQSPRMADHRLPCTPLKTLDSRLKDCGNGVVGTQRQSEGDSRGRKCPVSRRLKEKARRQRTLTLENDEVGEFFVVGTTNTTNTIIPK